MATKPKTVCVYVTTGSFTMLHAPGGGGGGQKNRMYLLPEHEVLTRLAKIVARGKTWRVRCCGWTWEQK